MKIKTIVVIGSFIILIILLGCSKEDETNSSSGIMSSKGVFTDSRDSNVYKWVKIGNQVWMAENLAYVGSGFQEINDTSWTYGTNYSCYYNNNKSSGEFYGVLYQWEAAKKACPDGWHLPNDYEWDALFNYLKTNNYSCDGKSGGSKIAKSLATNYGWMYEADQYSQYSVGAITFFEYQNKSGFSALPSGTVRYDNGQFDGGEENCVWWSSMESSNYIARACGIRIKNDEIGVGDAYKHSGCSIRCIRDYNP